MQIKNYFFKTADFKVENKMIISATKDRRDEYMNDVFYSLYKDEISKFKTTGKTALLYIGGAGEHHSCSRNFGLTKDGSTPVKSQLGYIASKTAKRIGNISYLSINSNACASSMYALYEAYLLINGGYDDVIIYGEEWVEDVELKLFKQHNIDIVCSDGFFVLHLCKSCDNPLGTILDVSWCYNEDSSPFEVSKEGYIKAMYPFRDSNIKAIKTHGSGTEQNNKAEKEAIKQLFGNEPYEINYKSLIGHSQGVSTGLELCMLLEEWNGSILLNASGLGNFYGTAHISI